MFIKEKIISFLEESSCYDSGTMEYLNTSELADAIFENEMSLAEEQGVKISSIIADDYRYEIERIADEMLAKGEIKSVESDYDGSHILVIPGSSKDTEAIKMNWKMPEWMKKYSDYIYPIFEPEDIENWMNDPGDEDDREQYNTILDRIKMLEWLYKDGKLI